MLIKKEQRVKKQISSDGFVYEYQDVNKNLGLAVSELNGRVPDEGLMKNKVCCEAYYVMNGSAKVFMNNEIFEINEGDVFHIKPNQEFYVEASNLKLVIPTSPAFYAEQWENVK
ncbi:MAG: hypothetical protein WCT50_00025 [Patescibacteria group bacterium]